MRLKVGLRRDNGRTRSLATDGLGLELFLSLWGKLQGETEVAVCQVMFGGQV